jgi:hypothetical protein
MQALTEIERAALDRLIEHARRNTGQSRRVADFLLAWWNAGSCGKYDITTAWGCDVDIIEDMIVVFAYASRNSVYPDKLDGYEEQFVAIVNEWRPELKD